MSETVRFSMHVGALADSVMKQVRAQGFTLDADRAKHFQRDLDALNRLRIRGVLTDGEARAGGARLVKKIAMAVGVPEPIADGKDGAE